MKILLAADHGGYELKEDLLSLLRERGYECIDMGPWDPGPVDYPDMAMKVAREVASDPSLRGILICGTGIGMSVVANRFPGVRAALCHDTYTAEMSRRHNDSNILVLGGRVTGKGLAREMVRVWLDTPFDGGRHRRRLEKIRLLETELLRGKGAVEGCLPYGK